MVQLGSSECKLDSDTIVAADLVEENELDCLVSSSYSRECLK
jgi:hypothetical protein